MPYLTICICVSVILILLVMAVPFLIIPVLYIIMIAVSYMLYTYYEKEIEITTINTKIMLSVLWVFSLTGCAVWYMIEKFPEAISAKVSKLDKKLKRKHDGK